MESGFGLYDVVVSKEGAGGPNYRDFRQFFVKATGVEDSMQKVGKELRNRGEWRTERLERKGDCL